VTIAVLDVNDESPVFQRKSYTFSVAENQHKRTEVGVVKAEDKDTKQLDYSIIGTSSKLYVS
jgi:hypothetical protein